MKYNKKYMLEFDLKLYLQIFKENHVDDIINFFAKSDRDEIKATLKEMYEKGKIEVFKDLVFLN